MSRKRLEFARFLNCILMKEFFDESKNGLGSTPNSNTKCVTFRTFKTQIDYVTVSLSVTAREQASMI